MPVFPTLDFIQIKARYPKAVAKVQEWIFSQPELQSVTDEFIDPKDPEKSKEMFIGLMIQMDPRKLYDVFDPLGIIVSVRFDQNRAFFVYSVSAKDHSGRECSVDTRHEAEVSAFHDAFDLLEKQS